MDDTGLIDLAALSEVAAGLPAPIKVGLFKSLSNLIGGLTSIPEAWLRRHTQAVNDISAGRTAVSDAIAKALAEQAVSDPAIMQAAAEIYLPTAVRKARNRVQVAQIAAEHVADNADETSEAVPPTDDWMNTFARFAEDASSERLQDLFGRILAGEIMKPGVFSLATIRTISELDQTIAEDFSLVWDKSVGGAVDYSSEFQLGEWFSRWKRLADAGLMEPVETAQHLPPFTPTIDGNSLWTPMAVSGAMLVIHFPEGCRARWTHIGFTRVGRQIGSILAPPDFAQNMRLAGQGFSKFKVSKVELRNGNNPVELLYQSDGD